ncbi:hypothetical protein AVEN_223260-1 [Araneus ventricosus]|uniref:Uncharacterized protein n=1 Tax=Araneus ventricosus TaxID=182803 RepID=A0A4Y2N6J1_ARAVE|nr:hypothetical protein AVEN_223260-1 [Araneus ventricosus]
MAQKSKWISSEVGFSNCKFSSDFRIGERICMVWSDRECPALKDCSCDHRRAICVSLHAKVVCWYASDLQKGIYLKAGPTCLTRFGGNHVSALRAISRKLFSHHCMKKALFQVNKCSEPRLGGKSGLMGVAPDFPLELLQQFLCSVAVRVLPCRRMIPSFNKPGRLRWMASRWPSDYFLFSKWKEQLSGTNFSTVM